VVIDLNVDTVADLGQRGRLAIFGDASQLEILRDAGIARAGHLIVTLPHSVNRTPLVAAARRLNPRCRILVRARYLREREELRQVGADAACFEEVEAAVALTERVLTDLGMDPATIAREGERVRNETVLESGTGEGRQADG
jgi:CPA2 family monovalent cation:H+ antiporter-2